MIELRQGTVDKFPADLTSFLDDGYVVRGREDQWNAANMVAQLFGLESVDFEDFLFPSLQVTRDIHFAFVLKAAMDSHERRLMSDMLGLGGGESTFGKSQIVDAVQEIGLPHPVQAHNTIESWTEGKLLLFVVFEMLQF